MKNVGTECFTKVRLRKINVAAVIGFEINITQASILTSKVSIGSELDGSKQSEHKTFL